MSVHVDYIIVGQGLAGSALSWELLNRGKQIRVFDVPADNLSSLISAGVCNPITGKAMTKTYLADQLFPYLNQWYSAAERQSGRRFFYPLPVYRPFLSREEQIQWSTRAVEKELSTFIERISDSSSGSIDLLDEFGGLWLKQSGFLNVSAWVDTVRTRLKSSGSFVSESFEESEMQVDTTITYKGLTTSKVIFCTGMSARKSAWFHWLPMRPLKGEILLLRIPLQRDRIISRGAYLVPGPEDGVFVVGSTYEHEPFSPGPSELGRSQILEKFKRIYMGPLEVIHQGWGIRPTVVDRRPLLGAHPEHGNLIIFNGLGTKGVSLTPYFAKRLADWMDGGVALPEEVNISRFKPLYSK